MHLAPRRIVIGNATSHVSGVSTSILAGCTASTSFARSMLARIKQRVMQAADEALSEHAANASARAGEFWTNVDDTVHIETGGTASVYESIAQGSITFVKEVRRRGLALSTKSAAISNPPSLAEKLSAELAALDVRVSPEGSTRDVGAATFRDESLMNSRRVASMQRWKSLMSLKGLDATAGLLVRSGPMPCRTTPRSSSVQAGQRELSFER